MRLFAFLGAIAFANGQFTSVTFANFNDGFCRGANSTENRPVGRCIREVRENHFRMLTCTQDGRNVRDVEYSDSNCQREVFAFDLETERCHEGRGMSVRVTCNRGNDEAGLEQFWANQATIISTPAVEIDVPKYDESLACVPRATIVSRAAAGAQGQYCECVCPHLSPWRCDCSGLTSYAWELPAPGHTTSTLPSVSVRLGGWAAMEPGDIILKPGTHVEVFRSWSTAGSVFNYCGCHNTADGCSCRTGATPSYWQTNGYYPAKFNNVC